jgi:hypothetical protein
MIKLKITVQPKSIKYLEFKQTLDAIKNDLQKYCTHLTVAEKENAFTIIADAKTNKQFSTIINAKEFIILSGAIKMLCEKSEIIIKQNNNTQEWPNLDKVRMEFIKVKNS